MAQQMIDLLGPIIEVIFTMFQAVGVILTIYSVAQLVLAIKNEDADSKSRAAMMMTVGVALIALPALIQSFDLLHQIGNFGTGAE